MNAAVPSSTRSSPVSVLRSRANGRSCPSPGGRNSSTTYGVSSSRFSVAFARSSMIFDARNSSRRCTTLTLEPNFARKIASSIALSPPPTTMIGRSLKKAASQVAQ